MKKILFSTFFLLTTLTTAAFFHGCSQKDSEVLPKEAYAIFDANSLMGLNSIPTSGCTTNTWVNLANSSLNGTIKCASNNNDGFDGTGNSANPYRVNFNGYSTNVVTSLNQQAASAPEATWMIWVYPTELVNATTQTLISIDDHLGSYNRALLINNGMFTVYNGSGTFSPVAADLNKWQFVVVTFTGTEIILYKNGIAYKMPGSPTIRNTAQTVSIGKSAGGNYDFFNGSIAVIGLYNRLVKLEEINKSCKSLFSRYAGATCNQ